mmetsp:Transcript_10949/g.20107  ORF Transcript_10949/g.20107 Transcript_10949/m.20107 type:complete len:612 (+) Transcript_10949:85-1920(+)
MQTLLRAGRSWEIRQRIVRCFSTSGTPQPPSIFNDVLGPVMRGPSSSHSAASLRIGRIVRGLIGGEAPRKFVVEYDPNGSLVTTHDGQGSDMGIFGGLMGWDADDHRLPNYKEEEKRSGMETEVIYRSYGATHPNTYRITATNLLGAEFRLSAISTGGGMFEITDIEGRPVNMRGDRYETLLFTKNGPHAQQIHQHLLYEHDNNDSHSLPPLPRGTTVSIPPSDPESTHKTTTNGVSETSRGSHFVHISSGYPLGEELMVALKQDPMVVHISQIQPVLPVLNRGPPGAGCDSDVVSEDNTGNQNLQVPFLTAGAMLSYGEDKGLSLWELACLYEAKRGDTSEDEVFDQMLKLVRIMRNCVEEGRAGTSYGDRILPCQSSGLARAMNEGQVIPGDVLNTVILYVTAIMEVKSSMGVIVAAPTAGSCGACPGTILGVADQLKKSEEAVAKSFLVAGMIGVLVAEHATFAAEMGGCMAECGAGSGMAAAAITSLSGGSTEQAIGAASLALQNSFGMTCDPIANRVEAPCLGKNVMAATNAISCSNMAMCGYRHLIPLDEVLVAMKEVGEQLPHELRCTGKGGISATPTARRIEADLAAAAGGKRPGGSGGKVAC